MSDNPLIDQIQDLEGRFDSFHDKVRMSSITREVSDVAERIKKLPVEIEQIRSRGYAFRSYLENKAEVLGDHWNDIQHRVQQAIDSEVDDLRDDIQKVEFRVRRLNHSSRMRMTFTSANEWLENLENKIEAAENRIQNMYSSLRNDVQSTFNQLTEINWFLDQKDEASFDFLAGESLFLAAKAEWVATGKGKKDPDGIIYLTDQRLIFEQKETTGKRLGMFGGKQEQEVEWALGLNTVEDVETENKGLFGGKDMLHFKTSDREHRAITVEVKGGVDCKFWQKQIQRMISGDVANERAIEPDPELLQQVREAPTACHVCGGTLPVLVAGQNQITCDYCGTTLRL